MLFLSPEEVEYVTETAQPAAQCRYFEQRGIFYRPGRSGRPKVLWEDWRGAQTDQGLRPAAEDATEGDKLLARLQRQAQDLDEARHGPGKSEATLGRIRRLYPEGFDSR